MKVGMQSKYGFSIFTAVLSGIMLLAALSCGYAQQQNQRDANLEALAGKWMGSITLQDKEYACSVQYAWILQDSFLEAQCAVYRNAGRTSVLQETKEVLKFSGGSTLATNIFSSKGVSKWGTYECNGKSWIVSLDASDGTKETGIIQWKDASEFEYIGTIMDQDGKLLSKTKLALKKQKD